MLANNTKIAAVIVTFNNPLGLKSVLEDLHSQISPLNEIIVVDNASVDDVEKLITPLFSYINYIKLNDNTGSAGGFHEGIRLGIKNNDFIWTLDDDLMLYNDTLLRLLKGLEEVDKIGEIGAVRSVCTLRHGKIFETMDSFAWRGTLIKTSAIKKVGLPIKEYFLYCDDAEYSQRLLKSGYKLFFIRNSLMKFSKENQTFYGIFGKRIGYYSDAFRLYYSFRNTIHLCLKYKLIMRFFRFMLYGIGVILCLVMQRREGWFIKIKAILEGMSDGLKSKLGKNYKYLPKNNDSKK